MESLCFRRTFTGVEAAEECAAVCVFAGVHSCVAKKGESMNLNDCAHGLIATAGVRKPSCKKKPSQPFIKRYEEQIRVNVAVKERFLNT